MKRTFSFVVSRTTTAAWPVIAAGTALIAATYGLVRLAYGLFLVDVQRDLGIDVAEAGAISGGASLLYCVAALVGFVSADRHARALVVGAGLTGAGGAAGMALAPDAGVFALSAVVASAGAGLASPAMVAVLQQHRATREHRGGQSQVNAGTGPGLVMAGVLALVLLPDWRAAWLIAAAATVLAAVAVLVLSGRRGEPSSASPSRALPPWSWFRAHGSLLIAALLMGVGSAALWNFGRTLLAERGADATVSVVAWIAIGAGGAAVLGTAGWLERMGPRRAWAVTVGAMAMTTGVLAMAATHAPVAWTACAVFGWGYTAGSGVLITWTGRIDPPRAAAGTAMLFVTLILGQAVGAALFGLLIPATDFGFAFAGAVVASVLAVAVACRPRASRR